MKDSKKFSKVDAVQPISHLPLVGINNNTVLHYVILNYIQSSIQMYIDTCIHAYMNKYIHAYIPIYKHEYLSSIYHSTLLTKRIEK